jgi:hypothetical protein
MDAVFMPEDARQYRAYRDAQREAYAWTRQQTPESALVLAQRDPLFYLETGRHAISRPIPPMHWYHDDRKAVVDSFRTLAPFARAHKLDYVYYAGADFGWAVDPSDRSQIDEAVRNNPELSTRFRKGDAAVYTLQPARVLAGN